MKSKKETEAKKGDGKNRLIVILSVIIAASLVFLLIYFLNDGASPFSGSTDNQGNPDNLPPLIKDEECKPGSQPESEEIDPKCNAIPWDLFIFSDGSLDEDNDLKPCRIIIGKYVYNVSEYDHGGEGDIRTQCAQDATAFVEEFSIEVPEHLLEGQPQWLLD